MSAEDDKDWELFLKPPEEEQFPEPEAVERPHAGAGDLQALREEISNLRKVGVRAQTLALELKRLTANEPQDVSAATDFNGENPEKLAVNLAATKDQLTITMSTYTALADQLVQFIADTNKKKFKNLEDATAALAKAVEMSAAIKKLRQQFNEQEAKAYVIRDELQKGILKDAGLESDVQFWQRTSDLSAKERELHPSVLQKGRWFELNIRRRSQTKRVLAKLSERKEQLRQAEQKYWGVKVEHQSLQPSIYAIENKAGSLSKRVSAEVGVRFAALAREFATIEPASISPETIESLCDDIIRKVVAPLFEKYRTEGAEDKEPLSEEYKAECVQVFKEFLKTGNGEALDEKIREARHDHYDFSMGLDDAKWHFKASLQELATGIKNAFKRNLYAELRNAYNACEGLRYDAYEAWGGTDELRYPRFDGPEKKLAESLKNINLFTLDTLSESAAFRKECGEEALRLTREQIRDSLIRRLYKGGDDSRSAAYELSESPSVQTLPQLFLYMRSLEGKRKVEIMNTFINSLTEQDQERVAGLGLPTLSKMIDFSVANPDHNQSLVKNPEYSRLMEQLGRDQELLTLLLPNHFESIKAFHILGDEDSYPEEDPSVYVIYRADLKNLSAEITDFPAGKYEVGSETYARIRTSLAQHQLNDVRKLAPNSSDKIEFRGETGGGVSLQLPPALYQKFMARYGFADKEFPAESIDNPHYQQFDELTAQLAVEFFGQAKTPEERQFAFDRIPYYADRTTLIPLVRKELETTTDMKLAERMLEVITSSKGIEDDFDRMRLLAEIIAGPHQPELIEVIQNRLIDIVGYYGNFGRGEKLNNLPEEALGTVFNISIEQAHRLKEAIQTEFFIIGKDTFSRILEVTAQPELFEFLKALQGIYGAEKFSDIRFLSEHHLAFLKQLFEYKDAVLQNLAGPDQATVQNKMKLLFEFSYYLKQNIQRVADIIEFIKTVPPDIPHHFVVRYIDALLPLSPEQRLSYLKIFERIEQSPSQEIQRLKEGILQQIISAPTLEEAIQRFDVIEGIFVKNNLPTVGKIFKVFSTLYPEATITRMVTEKSSPVLQEAGPRRRVALMYRDLLRAHLESGNRSLRDYLTILLEGEKLFENVDQKGIEKLSDDQRKRISRFLRHLNQLFLISERGEAAQSTSGKSKLALAEQYEALKKSLGLRKGQSVSQRITEMFLSPMGFASIQEALEYMQQAKQSADLRNRQFESGNGATLTLREGDLLKGVDVQYIEQILQNGSVAKEFLGAASDSDATPFDTDLCRVSAEDAQLDFASALTASPARGYGLLIFGLRPDEQIEETTADSAAKAIKSQKLELFKTGVVGERHYGIRTGFGTARINFMIARDELRQQPQKLEKVYYEIAKDGFYIPIYDERGNLIFSSAQFDRYREIFSGISHFEGPDFEYHPVAEGDSTATEVSALRAELTKDREQADSYHEQISATIKNILGANNVLIKASYDNGLLGADLYDTGSTTRHTNLPGGYDFDFALRLDTSDFPRAAALAEEMKKRFTYTGDNSHQEEGGYYQLRLVGVSEIEGVSLPTPIDIDIGFAKKSDLSAFASHDALREKFSWIQEHIGQEAYENTLANILFAKKVLKGAGAYKKPDGGFGGIGTENWIMAHHGNALEAFRAFREAAYDGESRRSFREFRERYQILDAGYNIKFDRYDNFIGVLKEDAYPKILDAIEKYL